MLTTGPRLTARGLALATAFLAAACAPDTPTAPALAPASISAADKQAALPGGALNLCKQAGAGLTAGTPYTFTVSLGGVLRGASVPAGSCAMLDVPRESAALSKGYFKAQPVAVAGLLPAGTTLLVGDAALWSAQAQAVLGDANDVASNSLLLNLAQQLIAADLNVLRGVQPSASVLQAITDANAVLHVVASGASVRITSALATTQVSALVDLLTAFNEGKTKPPATPATATLRIAESRATETVVAAIACEPAVQCADADLGAGTVTATVASAATTTVTYTNKGKTVLQVCKVGGDGIAAGTVFHFEAVLLAPTSGGASFDVPAGACRSAELAPGTYAVQETQPDGNVVSSIDCAPATRCGPPTLPNGFVGAVVVDGSTTTVTYTNRSTIGTLRVCKAAGPGIAAGTVFHFSAVQLGLDTHTASFDVPAGECRDASLPASPYIVQETMQTGTAVTAIDCLPVAACQSPNLGTGVVFASVSAQATVTVTYTNRSTLGTLRVCTIAGSGFVPGTAFHVSAARLGMPSFSAGVDVPAGGCGDMTVLAGAYAVTESVAGFMVAGITCDVAASCQSENVGAGFVIGTVEAQSTLTVTYVNSALAMLRATKARSSP